jgi:hypothetical protein
MRVSKLDSLRRNRATAVVPLMLTEKGKRANVQNEIVDEEHDAAGSEI